jgi:hypothetical protein
MPNTQLLMIKNRAHVAGFGDQLLDGFLANPYQKLISASENVVVE